MRTFRRSHKFLRPGMVLLALSLSILETHGQAEQEQEKQAQGQPAGTQILQSLRFPDSVEVGFTQRQLNPLLKRISSHSGVMIKSAQDGLIMRLTEPRFEERILNKGMLTLRRESRRHRSGDFIERHAQLDITRPSHLVLLALEALLNGRLEVIEDHFQLKASNQNAESEEQWQITLTPREEQMQQQLSAVHFFGREQNLTRFRSERRNTQGGLSHWLDIQIQAPPLP